MTKRMADAFFPANLRIINSNSKLSYVYHQIIFPEATAEECPEYVMTLDDRIHIRQPCLLIAAIWGIWIGYIGYRRFNRGGERNEDWAWALLSFGFMNVSAVWVHCLWPAPHIDYPTNYPIYWTIDTYMTGFSGGCLLVASLQELGTRWKCLMIRSEHLQAFSKVKQILGVLCILMFLWDPVPSTMVASYQLELWYLLPPLLAAAPVVIWVFEDIVSEKLTSRQFLSPISFSIGQLIFASALPVILILGLMMDHIWCSLIGYSLARDLLSANTLVFLGCDLAFWGIITVANERLLFDDETTKKKQE